MVKQYPKRLLSYKYIVTNLSPYKDFIVVTMVCITLTQICICGSDKIHSSSSEKTAFLGWVVFFLFFFFLNTSAIRNKEELLSCIKSVGSDSPELKQRAWCWKTLPLPSCSLGSGTETLIQKRLPLQAMEFLIISKKQFYSSLKLNLGTAWVNMKRNLCFASFLVVIRSCV